MLCMCVRTGRLTFRIGRPRKVASTGLCLPGPERLMRRRSGQCARLSLPVANGPPCFVAAAPGSALGVPYSSPFVDLPAVRHERRALCLIPGC